MNSLLVCRMKKAVFLRDARNRLLHFFHDFEGYAKCHSPNIKRIGWIWWKITTFAAEILNKLITRLQ